MRNNKVKLVIKRVTCLVLCCITLVGCASKQPSLKTSEELSTVDVEEQYSEENEEIQTDVDEEYSLTEDEAAKKVQNVIKNGCIMTVCSDGLDMKFTVTNEMAKVEFLNSKVYVDYEYTYMCSDEEETVYRAPVGTSSEEGDGFSINTDIESVESVKGSIVELFKSMTKPKATDDANVFTTKSTKDEFDEGYIRFENGEFIKLELVKGNKVMNSIEPFYGNVSNEINDLEYTDISRDEMADKVFELLFAALLTGSMEMEEVDNIATSSKEIKLDYTTQCIYSINENNKDWFAFNDTLKYEEYVDFCKEYGIEQKYAYTDKYYYVDVVTHDRPFSIIVDELALENGMLNENIKMSPLEELGGVSAVALIVVLDEEPNGTSVSRQYMVK